MTSNTRSTIIETMEPERSCCMECGAWGPVNEYHPFAYCALVKAIGEEAARANIDAVVAHGRKLERTALEASGRAVVPRAWLDLFEQEQATWARVLPHPQAGNSDLRYLGSLAELRAMLAAALPPRSE